MSKSIAITCESVEVAESTVDILLIPDGKVKSTKGEFVVDRESWESIVEEFDQRQLELPIDYEHQTVGGKWSSPDGKAPAAGWISELSYVPGEGIYGKVKWTSRARAMIREGEYKYLSPVIEIRKEDRKVMSLHSAALTNTPAIDGMAEVTAKESAMSELQKSKRRAKQSATVVVCDEHGMDEHGEGTMQAFEKLKTALTAMGLAKGDESAETLIDAAIAKLTEYMEAAKMAAKAEQPISVVANKLGLDKSATVEVVCKRIDEMQVKTVDVETFKAVQDRLAVLETEKTDRVARDVVAEFSRKINPNDKAKMDWAIAFARKDPDGFRLVMKDAPDVLPASGLLTTTSKSSSRTTDRDESKMIAEALKEYKNDARMAYVALQRRILEPLLEKGYTLKRATQVCAEEYPVIFEGSGLGVGQIGSSFVGVLKDTAGNTVEE